MPFLEDEDDLECEATDILEEETSPRVRVQCGVNWDLEMQADELLRKSRVGLTKVSEKQDFLTTDQLERRRCREVYNVNGVPDPALFSGLYRRAWNPNAGTRPNNDSHRFMDH